jgi:acyl carrier protein phosphodiesterase
MNFLAHLYLSNGNEQLITGNFLGDFLSNREVALLPEQIRKGIQMHRQIDTFTDQHPSIHHSKKLLRASHGKYAPVLLDVFHDYILAHNWERYSQVSLATFTNGMYGILLKHKHLMPDYLKERLPLMIADDWLIRYGTLEGLEFTFSRMRLRSSQPSFFDHAVESLQTHYSALEQGFHHFFPEVIAFVNDKYFLCSRQI